ncbi:type II secretion system F family protein [Alkaliphilus serpentinus]|uniref:Type II secretion system F family protein n=1 Tax=Alkaliphilus serpentinus TaxID=1482731 RepID=A0A833M6J6_9FIRM|nr:type II secretion system F family protein [Alkaliphilus serpentinus]KAB3527593.1 type II secretion system F family protein [Alkaliphilus serpentinus]
MPTFSYKATTSEGKTVEGTFVANSKGEVVTLIRESNQYPINIIEATEGKNLNMNSFTIGGRIKVKDISIFCRQFYTMLNAGVSIIASLDILKKQTENKRLREAVANIYEDLQKGRTLSEAMKTKNNIFPDLFINMVEAGEASGNLDTIMNRMAEHYEKENKINNKVKTAMMYPLVLSILALTVVVFLLAFVMPTFVSMFEGSGVPLPLPTKILLNISNTLTTYWYFFVAATVLMVFSFKVFISTEDGKYSFDSFKLKIPVVSNTIKKVATSRFSRTLSILLASGISLLEALDIVARVVGNKVLEKVIHGTMEDVRKGAPLSKPIRNSGFFPPMLDSMLQIGEESGALDDILEKTANFYDDEVETAIQKMTGLLEPLMIVFMALIIGAIVIAMLLPMFDMISTI